MDGPSLRSWKASMADRAIIVRFEGQSFGPARLRDRVFIFFLWYLCVLVIGAESWLGAL